MRRKGFTLVELLVVIGIIAVLISVLLPALSSARKQAQAVKCSAALREIGNTYQMYVIDNKGWAPPAKTNSTYRISIDSVPPIDYTAALYWYTFLAKYVSKAKPQLASPSAADREDVRKSLIYGCPSFEGYMNAGYTGGINMVQTGYGMNAFPEFTADFPPAADPPNMIGDSSFSPTAPNAVAVVETTNNWTTISKGTWYKMKAWTKPAERALVADAKFWLIESQAAPLNGKIPPQGTFNDQITWSAGITGQTLLDFYRHGKYPPVEVSGNSGYFAAVGGKVAYNVLFADGHVATLNSREDGYKATRMRYPG